MKNIKLESIALGFCSICVVFIFVFYIKLIETEEKINVIEEKISIANSNLINLQSYISKLELENNEFKHYQNNKDDVDKIINKKQILSSEYDGRVASITKVCDRIIYNEDCLCFDNNISDTHLYDVRIKEAGNTEEDYIFEYLADIQVYNGKTIVRGDEIGKIFYPELNIKRDITSEPTP